MAKKFEKRGSYSSQWYFDFESESFLFKKNILWSVPMDQFNLKFFLWTTDEEDRENDDPAHKILSIVGNQVEGRCFDPSKPEGIIIKDGKRVANQWPRELEQMAA